MAKTNQNCLTKYFIFYIIYKLLRKCVSSAVCFGRQFDRKCSSLAAVKSRYAPLAQLDRALVYGTKG